MIIHSDCLDEMKKMEDNSISAIVTDPPYGLHFMGKDWDQFKKTNFDETNTHKIKENAHGNGRIGFVNNMYCSNTVAGTYDDNRNDEFQQFIYQFGIEAIRIMKPGGHILMFGAPRRYHRQVSGLEDAGWEIRDCLMWIFGQGFPKSHNHFGVEGFGTALKPAYEPIIMAMKPCDGTFKQNAEKWGQAGINIDACRIPGNKPDTIRGDSGTGWGFSSQAEIKDDGRGRWPANVMFDEEAAKMLDEQSGELKSGKTTSKETESSIFGKRKMMAQEGSSGGASRFFYCAKTSSRERNEGLEGMPDQKTTYMATSNGTRSPSIKIDDLGRERDRFSSINKNSHPTVKPLKLMRYLISLIMPPKDGVLLDPFAGSGSTIIAAHQLGVKAIGIEKQAEYVEIANKRLEYYKDFKEENEPDLFDKSA